MQYAESRKSGIGNQSFVDSIRISTSFRVVRLQRRKGVDRVRLVNDPLRAWKKNEAEWRWTNVRDRLGESGFSHVTSRKRIHVFAGLILYG